MSLDFFFKRHNSHATVQNSPPPLCPFVAHVAAPSLHSSREGRMTCRTLPAVMSHIVSVPRFSSNLSGNGAWGNPQSRHVEPERYGKQNGLFFFVFVFCSKPFLRRVVSYHRRDITSCYSPLSEKNVTPSIKLTDKSARGKEKQDLNRSNCADSQHHKYSTFFFFFSYLRQYKAFLIS